ncbi:MAG: amidohydrolase family protein [Saprospiraceae bacterium]|jgi:hypothetical protein|nr:amidohydrolase family protein [Saprospiraceae bacterium]
MTRIFVLLLSLGSATLQAQNTQAVYQFINGNWFDGARFAEANWYSVGGKLTQKTPAKVDSVIDLGHRWVVPPLGDAFCSSLSEHSFIRQHVEAYTADGVFYLQILANTQEDRKKATAQLGKPDSPEAVFANGGFTCTLGHPFLTYEAPAQGVRNPTDIAGKYAVIREGRTMHGNGYWFVDSKKGVDNIWKDVMAQSPGVISIYLLDAQHSGGKENRGLSADAAKAVVKKAHKSGLRVFAHVETAEDVRLGLQIGVDGFANLPGHQWDGTGDGKKYELSDEDLKSLAKKKTPVVALFSHAQTRANRPNADEIQAALLKRLFAHGVNVVIGTDDPQRALRSEINYWFPLKDLDYAQAIQVFCTNTPQAIFPKRKIGRFAEGYEASFLVLNGDPLQNLLKLRDIAFKVRQGVLLKVSG